ncbi:MAG: hypothetical protein EBS65_02825 [Betaproteobacteria bacterium]|nr:hypothetical protein [Betaproteobacteria bacterium]
MKHAANTRRPKAANGTSPATNSTRRESFGSGAAQMAVQIVVKSSSRIVSMTFRWGDARNFPIQRNFFAPAGTPAAVVTALNAETVKAMRAPDLRERLASQGAEAVSNTPEQFSAYVKEELAKWTRVVKASGMKAE